MFNEDQFRVMVKFMEQHGDLRCLGNGNQREKTKKKWMELVGVLNRLGEKKTFVQWSKVWSDTKYTTVKKYKQSTKGGPQLTDTEKIVIKIIKSSRTVRSKRGPNAGSCYMSVIDGRPIRDEQNPIESLSDCGRSVKDELPTEAESMTDHPASTNEGVFYVLPSDHQQESMLSSNSSMKSSSSRRRNSDSSIERLDEIANKFYELERERDRMAHEREMARISQHTEFLSVMSRLVNVVESLAPSFKRILDRNTSGGG